MTWISLFHHTGFFRMRKNKSYLKILCIFFHLAYLRNSPRGFTKIPILYSFFFSKVRPCLVCSFAVFSVSIFPRMVKIWYFGLKILENMFLWGKFHNVWSGYNYQEHPNQFVQNFLLEFENLPCNYYAGKSHWIFTCYTSLVMSVAGQKNFPSKSATVFVASRYYSTIYFGLEVFPAPHNYYT